jgi:hypothetical protein
MRPHCELFTSRLNSLDDFLRLIHVSPSNDRTYYKVILISLIWSLRWVVFLVILWISPSREYSPHKSKQLQTKVVTQNIILLT